MLEKPLKRPENAKKHKNTVKTAKNNVKVSKRPKRTFNGIKFYKMRKQIFLLLLTM